MEIIHDLSFDKLIAMKWILLITLFIRLSAHAQPDYEKIEKIAKNVTAATQSTIDTVIKFTLFGVEGETFHRSQRIILSFDKAQNVIEAAYVYDDKEKFKAIYFDIGQPVGIEWINSDGDFCISTQMYDLTDRALITAIQSRF